jgi:hypothetical protein
MRKIWAIAVALLLENRWMILLLALWPWAFAGLMYVPQWDLTPDDLRSLLQQEYFYGAALTLALAASLYGGELRERRVAAVLCRAVSRTQYLAALWTAALAPGLCFAGSLYFSLVIAGRLHPGPGVPGLLATVLNLVVLEMWTTACGTLFSLLLPQLLATVAAGASAAVILAIGEMWPRLEVVSGLGPMVFSVLNAGAGPAPTDRPGQLPLAPFAPLALFSALLQACVLALISQRIFAQKDVLSSGS